MNYSMLKNKIACYGDKSWCDNTYLIGNEFGLLAIVYADNEQDALDSAVDNHLMNSELMTDADHKEYSTNGWDDSFIYLGNASEPFWSEYLWIEQRK